MMSDEYNLALGINFDYSSLVFANRILVDLMRAEEDLKSAIWRNGENRLGEILDECLAIVGKPVGVLNKADRVKPDTIVEPADARGVLLPEGGALYFSAAGSLPLYRL